MTAEQKKQLIASAIEVRQLAYAPYSHFAVGAAILSESGAIFTGCNVENASYGLTICAERVAVCAAVASGQRRFSSLVLAIENGGTPCGACRQFLAEFCENDLPVIIVHASTGAVLRETSLGQLLPHAFRLQGGQSPA